MVEYGYDEVLSDLKVAKKKAIIKYLTKKLKTPDSSAEITYENGTYLIDVTYKGILRKADFDWVKEWFSGVGHLWAPEKVQLKFKRK